MRMLRTGLMGLVVVGLLATPSLGVINIKLGTSSSVNTVVAIPGETYTVKVYAQGTQSGLMALGGSIVATGMPILETVGQFTWYTKSTTGTFGEKIYDPSTSFAGALPTNNVEVDPDTGDPIAFGGYTFASSAYPAGRPSPVSIDNWFMGGTPGPNGGMTGLGSGQVPTVSPNANLAKSNYVLVGSYNVKCIGAGVVTLNWVNADPALGGNGGWYTVGTQAGDWQIGSLGSMTFTTPEPATLTLLVLGGLLMVRRPRA